jgi:hypothetical protein
MEERSDSENGSTAGRGSSRLWQILLLLPLPPVSFLYLHLVRAARVTPSFVPVIVLAIFPMASILLAARRLGGAPSSERPISSEIALIAVALTELGWAAVTAFAVAFAIAARG